VIVAVGVDSVDIARIARLWRHGGERFARRLCTDAELAYCAGRVHAAQSLAARFAAKEAVMKCLGTGWGGGVTFRDVEVERTPDGAPALRLHGAEAARAASLGCRRFHLSLTHTDTVATAFVVAEG
jgi:holo-[acyl-carrier protein] synthase